MLMAKAVAAAALVLGAGGAAKADGITAIQAALMTTNDITYTVAGELAANIWQAQLTTPYAQVEPDSLSLSIAATERAINLWANNQVPWFVVVEQSQIAIDDQASVTLDPPSATFTASVPEPNAAALAIMGIGLLGAIRRIRPRA